MLVNSSRSNQENVLFWFVFFLTKKNSGTKLREKCKENCMGFDTADVSATNDKRYPEILYIQILCVLPGEAQGLM